MRPALAALGVALALAGGRALAADPAAAEREYRRAQRLAAAGAPEAAAALRRVLELDPRGALADDALVDAALLAPLADRPERLGRAEPEEIAAAAELLERAIAEVGRGDRVPQARYLRALLRLEPVPGHDPDSAREELAALAASGPESDETRAARYALAWIDARTGREAEALGGFHRLAIDDPASPEAARALVGVARIDLGRGDPGRAARWIAQAIERQVEPDLRAEPLGELAVREVLARSGAAGYTRARSRRTGSGLRAVADVAGLAGDGLVASIERDDRVVRLDASGGVADSWEVVGLSAITLDPAGRLFAAGGDSLWRLLPDGGQRLVSAIGEFAGCPALAADDLGGLWLVDRRGELVGRVDPGAPEPVVAYEDRAARWIDLAWDGSRLVALDARGRSIALLARAGERRDVPLPEMARPSALAADAAGTIAVLDARAGVVELIRITDAPQGMVGGRETFDCASAGIVRPSDVSLGPDGVLHLFDEADGGWFRTD